MLPKTALSRSVALMQSNWGSTTIGPAFHPVKPRRSRLLLYLASRKSSYRGKLGLSIALIIPGRQYLADEQMTSPLQLLRRVDSNWQGSRLPVPHA